jgi:hypothetical protein
MCLYVYGEAISLVVSHAAETITLNRDRSNDILIDLLLTNAGDLPLSTFSIIYPRALQSNAFCDETARLLLIDDPSNRFRMARYRAETQARSDTRITLTYTDRLSGKVLTGNVYGESRIRPTQVPTRAQYVLQASGVNFSLLDCSLALPIAPGEQRWFRWRVRVPDAPINPRTAWGYATDLLLFDRLIHQYLVKAPVDVRDLLLARLRAFISESASEIERELATAAQELSAKLSAALESSSTLIREWSITVLPGFFRSIRPINVEGGLVAAGSLLTHLPFGKHDLEPYSQWHYDASVSATPHFSLFFEAKHPNRVMRILSVLAIPASILGLVVSIVSLVPSHRPHPDGGVPSPRVTTTVGASTAGAASSDENGGMERWSPSAPEATLSVAPSVRASPSGKKDKAAR